VGAEIGTQCGIPWFFYLRIRSILWYNQVQFAIIPSVFEGFDLTVVETMAAVTSVISTCVASISTKA
jgi:hypothetical protein